MMVAILFGTGVFFGCAALTLDVGNINADRRQLQNGADAAVLSAAADCAKTTCPASGDAGLANLANKNAADGATKIARVDGQGPAVCGSGPGLVACPSSAAPNTGNLQECPAVTIPSAATGYVRVYTQTLNASRTQTLLPYSFGAALAGAGSGANQQTCAAAAWGPAGVAPILPFTFSMCEWYHDTYQDTDPNDLVPPANYAPFRPVDDNKNNPWEHAVALNSAPDAGCTAWQNHDFPGGFGWLDYDPATCKILDPINNWYAGDTGVGAGNQCGAKIQAAVGHVVYLPVFDCADDDQRRLPCAGNLPNGTNVWYHVKGAAAFFLTGVEITGQLNKSLPGYPKSAAKAECKADASGNKKCLYGWFLSDLVDPSAGLDGGALDLGIKAVQVIG